MFFIDLHDLSNMWRETLHEMSVLELLILLMFCCR